MQLSSRRSHTSSPISSPSGSPIDLALHREHHARSRQNDHAAKSTLTQNSPPLLANSFAYSEVAFCPEPMSVSFLVNNSSDMPWREVIQVYCVLDNGTTSGAERLIGWESVELDGHTATRVCCSIDPRVLSECEDKSARWRVHRRAGIIIKCMGQVRHAQVISVTPAIVPRLARTSS